MMMAVAFTINTSIVSYIVWNKPIYLSDANTFHSVPAGEGGWLSKGLPREDFILRMWSKGDFVPNLRMTIDKTWNEKSFRSVSSTDIWQEYELDTCYYFKRNTFDICVWYPLFDKEKTTIVSLSLLTVSSEDQGWERIPGEVSGNVNDIIVLCFVTYRPKRITSIWSSDKHTMWNKYYKLHTFQY